jgi:YfiH family protein
MNLPYLTPRWPAKPPVRAAFSWRQGGVSVAPFESLNLGTHVGDDAAAVAENRRLLSAALQLPGEPLWLDQVHGVRVLDADAGGDVSVPPTADAAVTRTPGRVLAIQVADCMPVLLANDAGDTVAAAHAGWRGLVGGVLEATVRAMEGSPRELHAWLGPAIRQANFEVGAEVRAAFLDAAGNTSARSVVTAAFSVNARGRWQCDLAALARQRLAALGLRSITDCGISTYTDAAQCFSYRRDGQTGRMAAVVWLQA